MNRKDFLKAATLASLTGVVLPKTSSAFFFNKTAVYYEQDTRKKALEWFKQARFGMFLHYGLYSIPGRGEWVQLREKIRVAEYAKLMDQFRAEKFNADLITDLALEAGMKYINLTTRHHDSFCLWDTKYSDFKSTNSPAKRDLVAELSDQCAKKKIAFFLYYSHGRDWKHPHAPNNDEWKNSSARPEYDPPETSYKYGLDHHLPIYLEFVSNQIRELLSNYGSIAGIWLDGRSVPLSGDYRLFHCQQLYDLIHSLQPQVLVSYKNGLLGTEDFRAPERDWKGDLSKPLELCDTFQPNGWGYTKADDTQHKTADQVVAMLKKAHNYPANLLLNSGPLPSGELHPADVSALKEVGKRIKERGWEALIG